MPYNQRITDFAVQLLQLDRPDRGIFDHIHGNTWAYIGWLLIAIGVGGFAEEVVMRGYRRPFYSAQGTPTWGLVRRLLPDLRA